MKNEHKRAGESNENSERRMSESWERWEKAERVMKEKPEDLIENDENWELVRTLG